MVGLPFKGNAKNIIPWLHRAQLTMTSQPIIATWETLWLGLAWRILRATGKHFALVLFSVCRAKDFKPTHFTCLLYHELLLKSIYKSREDSSTSLCMQYDKIKAFGNCNKYWNCSPVKIKHQTILFHYLCWDEDISSQKTDKWQLHGRVYRIEIDPLKGHSGDYGNERHLVTWKN